MHIPTRNDDRNAPIPAVVTVYTDHRDDRHLTGKRWEVDGNDNLHVFAADNDAVATYARGQWLSVKLDTAPTLDGSLGPSSQAAVKPVEQAGLATKRGSL